MKYCYVCGMAMKREEVIRAIRYYDELVETGWEGLIHCVREDPGNFIRIRRAEVIVVCIPCTNDQYFLDKRRSEKVREV